MEITAKSRESLSPEEINDMEKVRIQELDEAGIDEKEVLKNATQNINKWQSVFNENIVRGKDDMNFVVRDQWTAVERSEFTRLFKPAMTFNKLHDPIKKLAGEQRQNKPDLIVRSLTGKATQEQINLRADMVRTISYQSQNDLVYQSAFKSALLMGFGAFQICLDYESPRSFNKVIKYEMINDPTRCFWDYTATKPHKGDGNYCGRFYVFTKDEFFATYPWVTNPISYIDPWMILNFQWTTKDTVVVCDYFEKFWYPEFIYKLSDGRSVNQEELDEIEKKYEKSLEIAGDGEARRILEKEKPYVVNERQTQNYRIMHYRMLQNQILEFSEWPSKQLPLIFVDGDSCYIEGRQYTRSFTRDARDAQKALNYTLSEAMAEIKNRRREQWIATPDNIIGFEQQWRNPELQTAALIAKPDPKTGAMPIKQQAWEISQSLFTTAATTNQTIREVLGFSENENLQGKDISGKARRERKLEGSMSAYVWFDNLSQACAQGGRVVLDLLPYIIGDDERHFVITKKDGKSKNVILNERLENGLIKNQIEKGDFDIEIDAGPSFSVQKDMALEFFQETIAASGNPQLFNLVADLWVKNLDIQFMPQLSDRLKTLVPPQILAKEEGTPPPPPQPDPQQMMMQMEMQQKQAEMQHKFAELQTKQEQLELEKQKLLLEAQKANADIQLNVFDHQSDLQQAVVRHHLDRTKHENDYSLGMAKIMSDLHKHSNPQKNTQ